VRRLDLIVPFFLGLIFVSVLSCQQSPNTQHTTDSLVRRAVDDEDVVVRFYYNPLLHGQGTAHAPLVLMAASSQDPRLGTRSAWILYVSLGDLRRALSFLTSAEIRWKESAERQKLVVEALELPQPHHDSMQIAITSSLGSATAEIDSAKVCYILSGISDAVTNVKARDSLVFYQRTVFCLPPETQRNTPGGTSR
jgi:hypothetical protein